MTLKEAKEHWSVRRHFPHVFTTCKEAEKLAKRGHGSLIPRKRESAIKRRNLTGFMYEFDHRHHSSALSNLVELRQVETLQVG